MHDPVVVESLRDGFDPWAIGPDDFWDVVPFLLEQCPVAHGSDAKGDYFVVSRYADVLRVVQDWGTFQNAVDSQLDNEPRSMVMPPIDSNPPLQRHFRELLNPHLSPARVHDVEPQAREIVRKLLDGLSTDGPIDITSELFQPLPPLLTFRLLLGLQDDDISEPRRWVEAIAYRRRSPEVAESFRSLIAWLSALVAERRSGPHRGDVVDSLVHGTVDGGRPLTESEIIGTLVILLLGGFLTTTEASSTFVVRLAESTELQGLLRRDPSLIAAAIEEHLRMVPPVALLSRRCAADVMLGDREAHAGDRVGWMIAAANRDPREFDDPDSFDLGRVRNRHLTFGAGVHRCVGSHFARMSLRVVFEEILARYSSVRLADGRAVAWESSGPGAWRMATSVPVQLVQRS